MKIGVCGIGGRMGQAVAAAMLERGHVLGAAFEYEGSPLIGKTGGGALGAASVTVTPVSGGDYGSLQGLIDFSTPRGSLALIEQALAHRIPLVIGTTGFTKEERGRIESAAAEIPVVFSPNMSVGVNILFKLTEIAAGYFPSGFDVEIFEAHHKFKKDAPSGTAMRLLEAVRGASKRLESGDTVCGREGMSQGRSDDEIGMHALRGGDIVGEHTVYFCGAGERVELTHRATSRDNLARGAVIAAEYAATMPPGLYSMFDVLGLS